MNNTIKTDENKIETDIVDQLLNDQESEQLDEFDIDAPIKTSPIRTDIAPGGMLPYKFSSPLYKAHVAIKELEVYNGKLVLSSRMTIDEDTTDSDTVLSIYLVLPDETTYVVATSCYDSERRQINSELVCAEDYYEKEFYDGCESLFDAAYELLFKNFLKAQIESFELEIETQANSVAEQTVYEEDFAAKKKAEEDRRRAEEFDRLLAEINSLIEQ